MSSQMARGLSRLLGVVLRLAVRRRCLRVGRKAQCAKSSIMGAAHLAWSPFPLLISRTRNSTRVGRD